MQEDDIAILFRDCDGEVAYSRQSAGQLGQLVIMGGEKGFATQSRVVVQMLNHRLGDGHAVIGAGAPSNLVQHHQGPWSGLVQYSRRLHHLHHEGGLASGQLVL